MFSRVSTQGHPSVQISTIYAVVTLPFTLIYNVCPDLGVSSSGGPTLLALYPLDESRILVLICSVRSKITSRR
jgi:hypothetical protein